MHFVLCFWHIPQTRGIMPMMVLKYHVQKLMHVAICACKKANPYSFVLYTKDASLVKL